MSKLKYKRVLLKISGEGLSRDGELGLQADAIESMAREIKTVHDTGAEVLVVIGAGNFIRGSRLTQVMPRIQPATAHYMGMVATVLNGLALQDTLEDIGVPTRLQSALPIDRVCEKFIRRRCIRHLEKGRVVILGGGTGNPFVTTDTCAAQRAIELNCDVLLKATQVDGVYSADPKTDPRATRYDSLSFDEAIEKKLGIMDTGAFVLCQEHNLPIIVFCLKESGSIRGIVLGKNIGTRMG